YASMLLLALYTQKLLAYDAWTSGLVLAPGGLGNMLSLLVAGRLVTRVDQRMLLAPGCFINGVALSLLSNMTIGLDYWSLASARLKGLAAQFVAQGTDPFTAERRALSTLYGDLVNQARVLAYADEFWLLSMIFFGLLAILPFMRRVRTEPAKPREGAAAERVEALPTPTD